MMRLKLPTVTEPHIAKISPRAVLLPDAGMQRHNLYSYCDHLENETPRLWKDIRNGNMHHRDREKVRNYRRSRQGAYERISFTEPPTIVRFVKSALEVSNEHSDAREFKRQVHFRPSTRRHRFVKGQVLSLGGGPNQHCDHQYDYPSHVYSIAHLTSNTKSGGVT
jgi:hypothetical protein